MDPNDIIMVLRRFECYFSENVYPVCFCYDCDNHHIHHIFLFFYFKRKKPTKWFISYTTKDREVSLEFLKKYKYILINKMDIDAYIDLIDNDKTSTHEIQKKIEREIRKSKKLILINTNSVKNSEWVNFELETANKNSIIIEEKK